VTIAVLLRNLVVCLYFIFYFFSLPSPLFRTKTKVDNLILQRLIANRPRPEGTSDATEKARNEVFQDG
jgi:hypothetical protein